MNYDIPAFLAEIRVQGVALFPDGDMIAVTGSPSPTMADEIRRLKPALLLHLQKQRALELASVLDGPGDYDTRMKHWTEYQDLCARIAEHDRGSP